MAQCDQFRYTSPAFDSISTSTGSEVGERAWGSSTLLISLRTGRLYELKVAL